MIVLDSCRGCRGIVVLCIYGHFLPQGRAVRSVLPRRRCSDVESHTRQGPTDQHNETMRRVMDNQVTVETVNIPRFARQEDILYQNIFQQLSKIRWIMTHSKSNINTASSAKQLWVESCHHTARSGALPWRYRWFQVPSCSGFGTNLTSLKSHSNKKGGSKFWSWAQTNYKPSIVILQESIAVPQLDISDEWIPMCGWSIGCLFNDQNLQNVIFSNCDRYQPPPKKGGQPIFHGGLCSLSPARNCVVRGENDSHLMEHPANRWWLYGNWRSVVLAILKYIASSTSGNRFEVEKHTSCTYWMGHLPWHTNFQIATAVSRS